LGHRQTLAIIAISISVIAAFSVFASAEAIEHTSGAREIACKIAIDKDDSLTYAEKLVAKKKCQIKSLSVPTNTQDCLEKQRVNFQKQNTDLFIVNHWARQFSGVSSEVNINSVIMGEIVNLSNHPLTDIVISIKTFKEGEMFDDISSWHPIKKILRPEESSPFGITPSLTGFDSYEIWVSNYNFSCSEVIEPRSMIKNIIFDVGSYGTETITMVCDPKVATRDLSDTHILFVAYNEDNFIDAMEIGPSFLFDSYDCFSKGKVTGNLIDESTDKFLGLDVFPIPYAYVKDERLELFTIEGFPSVVFNEKDVRLQIMPPQTTAYSKYYPDSLVPKFMNIDQIRTEALEHGTMHWSWPSQAASDISTQPEENIIPDWIRNNAEWWAGGAIRDSDFVGGIQYLIKENIIEIPETTKAATPGVSQEIPSWIKNNADWWSQGLITDDDFVKGIQYLVEQGIIQV